MKVKYNSKGVQMNQDIKNDLEYEEYINSVFQSQEYRISQKDEPYPGSIVKIITKRNLETGKVFVDESRTSYRHAHYLSPSLKEEMIRIQKTLGLDKEEPFVFRTALIESGLYENLSDSEKEELNKLIDQRRKEFDEKRLAFEMLEK